MKIDKCGKLMCNLYNKTKYVLYCKSSEADIGL